MVVVCMQLCLRQGPEATSAGVRGVWKKSLKIETGLRQSAKFEKVKDSGVP